MIRIEQMIECAEQMEHGMIQTQTHRDMWQNNLVWWLCKAVKLLLEERIRERDIIIHCLVRCVEVPE